MNSRRLWVTVVAIFALSACAPRSSGAWAQQAACPSGWDWVRFFKVFIPITKDCSRCFLWVLTRGLHTSVEQELARARSVLCFSGVGEGVS